MGVDAEMVVRVPRPLTRSMVIRESVRMCVALGSWNFHVRRPGQWADEPDGQHALEIVQQYPSYATRDEAAMRPGPNETLVQVHMHHSYYGPGYERGNLIQILAIGRWLERELGPGATVYYGGDNSDELAPLDAEALLAHLRGPSGRAYYTNMSMARLGEATRSCEFCGIPCVNNMGGGGRIGCYCPGCAGHWLTQDNGRTWTFVDDRWRAGEVFEGERARELQDVVGQVALGDARITKMRTSRGHARDDVGGRAWQIEVEGSALLDWDQLAQGLERAGTEMVSRAGELSSPESAQAPPAQPRNKLRRDGPRKP